MYKQRSWSSEAAPTHFLITLKTLLISSLLCCKPHTAQPLGLSIYTLSFKISILKNHLPFPLLCCVTWLLKWCQPISTVILKGIIRKQKKRQWLQDRQRLCQLVAQLSNVQLWWDWQASWWAMKLWKGQGDTWRLAGSQCGLYAEPGTLQPPAANASIAQSSLPRQATNFISCHSSTWVYRTGCLLCKYSLS